MDFKLTQEQIEQVINMAKQSGMEDQKILSAQESIALAEAKRNSIDQSIQSFVLECEAKTEE